MDVAPGIDGTLSFDVTPNYDIRIDDYWAINDNWVGCGTFKYERTLVGKTRIAGWPRAVIVSVYRAKRGLCDITISIKLV